MKSIYSCLAICLLFFSGYVSANASYQVLFLEEVAPEEIPSPEYYELQRDDDDDNDDEKEELISDDSSNKVLFIREGITVQNSLASFEPGARVELGTLLPNNARFSVGVDGGLILTNYKNSSATMPQLGVFSSFGVGGFLRIEGKYYRVWNQNEVEDFAERSPYKFDAAAVFPVRNGVDIRVTAAFDRDGFFGLPKAGFTLIPSRIFGGAD
jgi:hypothetical protein